MLRNTFLLGMLVLWTSAISAQVTTKSWSYPYGEGSVALEQAQPGSLAILLAPGIEDGQQIVQGVLKSTAPLLGGVSYKEQEYPGLYYLEASRRLDQKQWLKLTEVLTQSPDLILAAPLLKLPQPFPLLQKTLAPVFLSGYGNSRKHRAI